MRFVCAILAVLATLGGCTRVQEIRHLDPIGLVLADPAAQARAVAYQLPDSPSRGTRPAITVLRGAACVLGSQRAAKATAFEITDAEYASVFQDEFRRAGYRAFDAVAAGAPDGASAGAWRIVAEMSEVRMNVCLPEADAANPYDGKGEAAMTVRWLVYPAAGGTLLYASTQPGYARIDTKISAAGRELLRTAFARSIHGLLADEGFRAAMRAPAR
jgi:hypothetical protein